MSTSKQQNILNNSTCIICEGKIEEKDKLTIKYCCKKEAHLDCWFTKMKLDKTKCCHCYKIYSNKTQSNIQQNIERKERIEREYMNNIFKYIHKQFFKMNKAN